MVLVAAIRQVVEELVVLEEAQVLQVLLGRLELQGAEMEEAEEGLVAPKVRQEPPEALVVHQAEVEEGAETVK